MSITKWNPTKELLNMEHEYNTLLNSFSDMFNIFRKPRFDEAPERTALMPLADLSEDKNNYMIQLDIPGINRNDIKITLTNGIVTISGERKFEKEKNEDTFHTIERSYGKFCRSFRLPLPVKEDKIDAVYKNGQLSLIIPKAEESKAKQIEISIK